MKRPIINQFEREAIRLNTTLGAMVNLRIKTLHFRRDLDKENPYKLIAIGVVLWIIVNIPRIYSELS